MKKSVFISHNSNDKATAREIGLFLISEDVNVWFDEWEINYGASIPQSINKGLNDCTHFLLLWSEHAQTSKWVEAELNSIINLQLSTRSEHVKIIPLCLDDTPLPRLISHYRYIKYSGGSETDRREIVSAVTDKLPSRNYIKAIVKKYNEVIFDTEANDPFMLKACPACGETDLQYQGTLDEEHDEKYYFVMCKACGWSDWTQ